MSTLPPAQPSYIFRGHTAQIHSVQIIRRNTRLLTGDGDGWVVLWKLESKRPLAVWKGHDAAILGTSEWGPSKVITHGRDNSLRIWQLRAADESSFSSILPADGAGEHRPKPWLLHALPVNTLNFCAFSMTYLWPACSARGSDTSSTCHVNVPVSNSSDSVLVAVPARDDKKVEVYQFPEEKLHSVVPRVQPTDTGMVMAVKLVHHAPSNNMIVITGYEGGYTAVHLLSSTLRTISGPSKSAHSTPGVAQIVYLSQPHSQPLLSLDALPDGTSYFTSSADAVIASHRVPELPYNDENEGKSLGTVSRDESSIESSVEADPKKAASKTSQSEDSAQASTPLANASTTEPSGNRSSVEEKVNDNSISDQEQKTQENHTQEPQESTLSFSKRAVPSSSTSTAPNNTTPKAAGLSSLLSSAPSPSNQTSKPSAPTLPTTVVAIQPPQKTTQTKHSGQQSLRVRSDGRLFITGGWDSRARIYSTKTLNEVAVLKWHKEGVYAAGFGEIVHRADIEAACHGGEDDNNDDDDDDDDDDAATKDTELARRETGLGRLQRRREEQMRVRHWAVAGSKDGRISLWEVF